MRFSDIIEQTKALLQREGRMTYRSLKREFALAVSHLTFALELPKTLLDTLERAQQELTLQIMLGFSLIANRGYTAPAVGQAFTRARELCQQVGETPQLLLVLRGLFLFHSLRADYETARELAHQGLSAAQRLQDSTLLLGAYQDLGFFSLWPGEWQAAREYFARTMTFYDPQEHRSYVAIKEADQGVWAMIEDALALWCLGYPDQARQKSEETLRLAQKLTHPNTLGWTLICVTWLHQYLQEPQKTQEQAETTIALSHEHGFPMWLAWGTVFQGWALAMQGQREEGIAYIRQGMATARSMGTDMARSHHLALLAEALNHSGQIEEGLTILTEALEFVARRGERVYEAELYRLKGELTLQSQTSLGQVEDKSQTSRSPSEVEKEAEECFLKAIEVAQKQQAKSWELRASTCLARFWQQQGKRIEARDLLAPVYNWFTEGFDTKDLQGAKVLLEALSH